MKLMFIRSILAFKDEENCWLILMYWFYCVYFLLYIHRQYRDLAVSLFILWNFAISFHYSFIRNPLKLEYFQIFLSRSRLFTWMKSVGQWAVSLPWEHHLKHSSTVQVIHRFSKCCGPNITLTNNNTTAKRVRHYNHGLVFTSHPLEPEELFEVCSYFIVLI